MKKVLIRILCAALMVMSITGLVFGGMNIRSILDTKNFWEEVKAEALENFDAADAGIAQLKENESKYTEGVETAEAGKAALNAGGAELAQKQPLFNESEAALAQGHATYEQKYAEYEAGLQKLEEGRATLAAGEQMLAENKQAYEEGKAKLARVEPLYNICMGHKNAYDAKLAEYNAALEEGDTVKANALKIQVDIMRSTYEAGVEGLTMQDIVNQYNEGLAQIQAYEEGMRTVEKGRADIAAGEAAAAEAKKQLDAAKATLAEKDALLEEARGKLNDGISRYESGKRSLNEGLKQLSVFEGGQAQIAEGLNTIIGTDTYYNKMGEPIVQSIAHRLGANYNFYKLDENGEILILNDQQAVDLDKAAEVVQTGRAFVADTEIAVTHECMGRAYATILLLIASLIGLAASIIGLAGKFKGAGITAAIGAVLALAGLGVELSMNPYGYPLSQLAQCPNPNLTKTGIIMLLAAAVLCAVTALIYGKKTPAPELETIAAEPVAERVPEASELTSAVTEVKTSEPVAEVKVYEPLSATPPEEESHALKLAKIELEKARAEAEKAKALAEHAKAELELYRLKMSGKESAPV